ncbi:MAG: 7TM diverse intracellular signaling domain-containing protein [Flavobacteriia bacterium]
MIYCINKFHLTIFISLVLAVNLNAQRLHQLEYDFSIAIDSNSTWTIDSLHLKRFQKKNLNETIAVGYNENFAVWCKLMVKNRNVKKESKYFSIDNINIDSLEFFDGKIHHLIGDRTNKRSPFLSYLAFRLKLQGKEQKEFYFRIKKGISFLDFKVELKTKLSLQKKSDGQVILISIFLGISLILFLYIAILFVISKNSLFFYYLSYSSLSIVYVLVTTGFLRHYFFPEFLNFSELRIYLGSLWFVALTFFLIYFLKLKTYQKAKFKALIFLCVLNISFIVITLVLLMIKSYFLLKLFSIVAYLNFIAIIVLILWSTFAHLKYSKNDAIYVFVAFFPQFIWSLSIILKAFKILPKDIDADWLVIIAIFEIFLFAYVLIKKYIEVFLHNSQLIKNSLKEKDASLQMIKEAQIHQRKQIANIIHDNFGSRLAHLLHLLEMNKFEEVKGNLHELSKEIRAVSHEIMPKSLSEGALISALNTYLAHIQSGMPNCKFELIVYDFSEKINQNWVIDMYLISMEIINNSLKHGKPKNILLEFFEYGDEYCFQYSDDGVGFNELNKGFGLNSIISRIEFYGGEIDISSEENHGTVIQIRIPKQFV